MRVNIGIWETRIVEILLRGWSTITMDRPRGLTIIHLSTVHKYNKNKRVAPRPLLNTHIVESTNASASCRKKINYYYYYYKFSEFYSDWFDLTSRKLHRISRRFNLTLYKLSNESLMWTSSLHDIFCYWWGARVHATQTTSDSTAYKQLQAALKSYKRMELLRGKGEITRHNYTLGQRHFHSCQETPELPS